MNKKGQITVFIALGLIILIAGGLYLVTRDQITEETLSTFTQLQREDIPVEFTPTFTFVERCLEQTAKQGIVILGQRGGFIDLLGNNLLTRPNPTDGDAVAFSPGSTWSIPYWWHLSSSNTCSGDCDFTMVPNNKLYLKKGPGRTSVEAQLEDYIEQNLNTCLQDFQELKAQGFDITIKDNPEAQVNFADKEVLLLLHYPLLIKKASERETSTYIGRLNLDFKTIFNTAKALSEMQAERQVIEKHILNLFKDMTGVDRKKLPPFASFRPSFSPKVTWPKNWVESSIQRDLLPRVNLLQVYGANNYEPYQFPNDPFYDALYNSGTLLPGSLNWSHLKIDVDYNPDWWDMYFDVDCDDTCEPETIADNLVTGAFFSTYRFTYDLSFPVHLKISDPSALNNEGYDFHIFLEANLRQNEPLVAGYERTSGIEAFGESLLCEEDQRNSGNYTIIVVDALTNQLLDEVGITFSTQTEPCFIGQTEAGKLKTAFPIAFGPVVSFSKNDYITYYQKFEPRENKQGNFNIALTPILDKQFNVRKVLLQKPTTGTTWTFKSIESLVNEEQAIITLTRLGTPNEADFSTVGTFRGNQTTTSQMKIAPGDYEMSISLIDERPFLIPATTMQVGDDSFPIDAIPFDDGFRTGGALLNITFTKHNLPKDNLTFHTLAADIHSIPESQRKLEDINALTGIDQQSWRHWAILTQELRKPAP